MDTSKLTRTVSTTTKYNKYFKGTCNATYLGTGNSDLSIDIMSKWVEKYKHQCKELALSQFANQSLHHLPQSIHSFLYNHIQYKLDGTQQKIRSPFCAWTERFSGIDCKSFTVFASCILSNLGVFHYITKIKQANFYPDQFTHVFIRVPIDQKTKNLDKGYYVIDAVLKINREVNYVGEPKNKLMSNVGLEHYGLGFANQPQTNKTFTPTQIEIDNFKKLLIQLENKGVIQRPQSTKALERLKQHTLRGVEPSLEDLIPNIHLMGLSGEANTDSDGGGGWFDNAAESVDFENIFKDFKWSDIGGLFSRIDCIGGSAYGGDELKSDLDRLKEQIAIRTKQINQAVFNRDLVALNTAVSLFYGIFALLDHTASVKQGERKWNSCSNDNFTAFIEQARLVRYNGGKALNEWLKVYFNKTLTGKKYYHSSMIHQFWIGYVQPYQQQYGETYVYTIKDADKEIKPFVFNHNILQQDPKNFNITSYLNSIKDILVPGKQPNNTGGNNTGDNNTGGFGDTTAPQKAGIGIIPTVLLVGTAIYVINEMSSKKSKAKK